MHYYIAEIRISNRVREKVAAKHGISQAEVFEAFKFPAKLLRAGWDWSEEHQCYRLLAEGETSEHVILKGVLYPANQDEGIWWLATCIRASSK